MVKNFFLFLSLMLWWGSNLISNYCFPTTSPQDIDNYWELRKIIYSTCIILALLSCDYKTRFSKFLSLVFIGLLFEDISDRLQGITYFEYSDYFIIDLVIVSALYIAYKDVINFKNYIFGYFRSIRR